MPFPQKIQPIDGQITAIEPSRFLYRSRLKRFFFERQKEPPLEIEPSSPCLAKLVQNFIEPAPPKPSPDPPLRNPSLHLLKRLSPCETSPERLLLGDVMKVLSEEKSGRRADRRRTVVESLRAGGYDAGICLCRWDGTPAGPAGEYEFVDVAWAGGGRAIVDLEFRSEFEIARSTRAYRAALRALPAVFVGGERRLEEMLTVISDAARLSLKKKGLHVPPWRRIEYLRAKWLSPSLRTYPPPPPPPPPPSLPLPPSSPAVAEPTKD